MITRDDQGRQVYVLEETPDELGMTITDGAVYRFKGHDYIAALEDTASDYVAYLERLPVAQEGNESHLTLDREGSLRDDIGANVGDYNELEMIEG